MTGNALGGDLLFYRAPDGRARVEVRLDRESVWLSQDQMSRLFGRERSVIAKHIRNIFQVQELPMKGTCAKFAQVHTEGHRTVTREIDHYNLDVIISVGYRVNSKRGVQFRQWATGVLRQYLLKGYALNQARLTQETLDEAQTAIALLSKTLTANVLLSEKGKAVLDVVIRYARAWRLLWDYDEGRLLTEPRRPTKPKGSFSIQEAREMVGELRARLAASGEAGALFGRERGNALEGVIGALHQTFGGQPLYPSAQARATHLFYFVIKDHPFGDGNKRIASLLFLAFLKRNGLFLSRDGIPRFAGNAVVALALLIAESAPKEKDTMIRLVLSLLEDE